MPEVKRLRKLLFLLIFVIQLACALENSEFDHQLAVLLEPIFPNSQHIKVLSELNQHQKSLIASIEDKKSIELVKPKVVASSSNLLVKLKHQGKIELLKFPANIKVFQNVLTTKRAVSRKEKVSTDNFHYKTKDILKINGQPFILGSGSYCYNYNLTADQSLTTWQVSRIFDINKYDQLNALVTNEEITLKITVTALQSGFIGDKISVKFPSGKKIKGTIEDTKTIRVRI